MVLFTYTHARAMTGIHIYMDDINDQGFTYRKSTNFCYTVEPPIKDPPNKGHNRKNLPIKDTFPGPKCSLSHSTIHFLTSERGQSPYKGQNWLVPKWPFSVQNCKMHGQAFLKVVGTIRKFHCIYIFLPLFCSSFFCAMYATK